MIKSIGIAFVLLAAPIHTGLVFQSGHSNNVPALSLEDTTPDARDFALGAHAGEPANQKAHPSFSPTHQSPISDIYRVSGFDRLPFESFRNAVTSILVTTFHRLSPFHSPPPLDLSKYTIWEVLNWTLTHPPEHLHHEGSLPLHRLAWLANLSAPIKEILSDPTADFTFFAPDDDSLTPPSKRHHKDFFGDVPSEQQFSDASNHIFWEALEGLQPNAPCLHGSKLTVDEDEDDHKKKKIFSHIVELVLRYSISPGQKSISDLLDRNTLSTDLKIAHDHSAPVFRIRVGAPAQFLSPREVALNIFTRIDGRRDRPIITKNGVIYITHKVPLLPPFSPLSQLFLFPRPFSTLTSAIQKVHLDQLLLPHWANKTFDESELDQVDTRVQDVLSSLAQDKTGGINKRSFTVFAPTNRAFRKLGLNLNEFLFSPFGAHILRYLLSYHIVPDVIWYTDHVDNATSSIITRQQTHVNFPIELSHLPPPASRWNPKAPGPYRLHFPDSYPHGKVNITDFSLPTLLGSRSNETLNLSLVEFRKHGRGPVGRRVYIKQSSGQEKSEVPKHHDIPVVIPNLVAWGGALHAIPSLIRPPIPEHHKGRKDVQKFLE